MQYLYLIRCQDYHKIGIANDVESRLAQLSTGNPYPLEVVSVYGFQNAQPVEASLHQRFSASRIRGEWFRLNPNDVLVFGDVCNMLMGEKQEVGHIDEDEIEEAEQEQDYALVGGKEWRLEARNDSSVPRYAIMSRGRENRRCIGYLGIRDMKDPYNPTVEEVEAVLALKDEAK